MQTPTNPLLSQRKALLYGELLAYQTLAPDVAKLPWTAGRLALMQDELTALQAGDVATADALLSKRTVHEMMLDD